MSFRTLGGPFLLHRLTVSVAFRLVDRAILVGVDLGELLVELLLKLGAGHRLVLAMAMMLGNRHSRYRKHAGGRGQQENFLHPSSPVVASLPADADSLNRRNILYCALTRGRAMARRGAISVGFGEAAQDGGWMNKGVRVCWGG